MIVLISPIKEESQVAVSTRGADSAEIVYRLMFPGFARLSQTDAARRHFTNRFRCSLSLPEGVAFLACPNCTHALPRRMLPLRYQQKYTPLESLPEHLAGSLVLGVHWRAERQRKKRESALLREGLAIKQNEMQPFPL